MCKVPKQRGAPKKSIEEHPIVVSDQPNDLDYQYRRRVIAIILAVASLVTSWNIMHTIISTRFSSSLLSPLSRATTITKQPLVLTTMAQVEGTTLTKEEIAMAQLGDMFFNRDSSTTIRSVCANLDSLNKKQGEAHGMEVFQHCMKELERGQALVRSKLNDSANNQTRSLQNAMASCSKPQLFLHSFWDGPLEQGAQLGLISSVYAHGPGCSKLTIWTTGARNIIEESMQPFLGQHFQVRTFNATQLVVDHILPRYPDLQSLVSRRRTAALMSSFDTCPPDLGKAAYSDLVRVLVLAAQNETNNNGGGAIYLDSDVLVLNSLVPLISTHKDFWYQWSTRRFANTAIYSSQPGSPALNVMMKKILTARNRKRAAEWCHPWELTRQVGHMVEMLPSAYFDPHWVSPSRGVFFTIAKRFPCASAVSPSFSLSSFSAKSVLDLGFTAVQKYARDVYGTENFGLPFFEERSYTNVTNNREDASTTTTTVTSQTESFFPGAFAYHW